MANNKLVKLDFTPGIRAKDINDNFDVIDQWIKDERACVGGVGIIDGFDISVDLSNFNVHVSSGRIVTFDGSEEIIPETSFSVGAPEYITRQEKLICPEDGIMKLASKPYSPSKQALVKYVPPYDTEIPSKKEFHIMCALEGKNVPYLQISGDTVYINQPEYWRGKELTFDYLVTNDRVDAILLNSDGTYKYQKSIVAASPSHVDLEDYDKGYMMIGVVHWQIGEKVSANIYTNHRSYRRVYVDKNNRLYINGKLYEEPHEIYLKEPEQPQENDFWYDIDNEVLLIYRQKNGIWGWQQVNDFSTVTMREVKMWTPDTWPLDNQTFLFDKEDINLRFVPNTNALEIFVDNATLMQDQFSEIVSEGAKDAPSYMAQGIGFRLKKPLDHPTYLQLTVNHRVRTSPTRETFQRSAIFINENHDYMTETNKEQIFKTEYPYVVGGKQLEVFVDGLRLAPGVEIQELLDNQFAPTDAQVKSEKYLSHFFKVKKPLKAGQFVDHKLTKQVWSYDQVSQLLGDTFDDVRGLRTDVDKNAEDIKKQSVYTSEQFDALNQRIDSQNQTIDKIGSRKLAIKEVKRDNIDDDITVGLVNQVIDISMNATLVTPIQGAKDTDFIQVHLLSKTENRILIRAVDYTLANTTKGLRIDLSPELAISGNTIYVTGFIFGRR